MLSRGVFTYDWSPQSAPQLQVYANQPTWPEGQQAVPYTQQRTWLWDGQGTEPYLIGHQIGSTAITETGTGAVTVTESRSWNAQGLLQSRQVTVNQGQTSSTFTLSFAYDNQGRLLSVTYPPEAGLSFQSVVYSYDGRDGVLSIADDAGNLVASYTYNAAGNPITMALGDQAASGNFGWDSPGRMLEISVQSAARPRQPRRTGLSVA